LASDAVGGATRLLHYFSLSVQNKEQIIRTEYIIRTHKANIKYSKHIELDSKVNNCT